MSLISLGSARDLKKLKDKRQQLLKILENNRQALQRLFETGVIYHAEGSRAGRDLLYAHELLLKILDIIDGLSTDDIGTSSAKNEKLARLRRMLERTSALTVRGSAKLKTLLPRS